MTVNCVHVATLCDLVHTKGAWGTDSFVGRTSGSCCLCCLKSQQLMSSFNTSARNGTVAKLYAYSPPDLLAVVSSPCRWFICARGHLMHDRFFTYISTPHQPPEHHARETMLACCLVLLGFSRIGTCQQPEVGGLTCELVVIVRTPATSMVLLFSVTMRAPVALDLAEYGSWGLEFIHIPTEAQCSLCIALKFPKAVSEAACSLESWSIQQGTSDFRVGT